ncbi:hypothetical protein ACFLTG_01535 [Chloroflexota bacterium]
MSGIVAKIIIKVYLVSGKEITHIYEVPKSDKEMEQFLKDIIDKEKALIRGEINYLYFENPNITYNSDNVEGIEISSLGVKQLELLLRKAQSKTGFIK